MIKNKKIATLLSVIGLIIIILGIVYFLFFRVPIIKNYEFSVPSGSKVSLLGNLNPKFYDNKKFEFRDMSNYYLRTDDALDVYRIPEIYSGTYDFEITIPLGWEIWKTIDISKEQLDISRLLDMNYAEQYNIHIKGDQAPHFETYGFDDNEYIEKNIFPEIAKNTYNAIYANLINNKTFADLETTLNHKSPILEKEYKVLENKYKNKLLSFTITKNLFSYNVELTDKGYYKISGIMLEYRYNLEGQVMTTSNGVNIYLGYNDGKFIYKDAENIIKDFSY